MKDINFCRKTNILKNCIPLPEIDPNFKMIYKPPLDSREMFKVVSIYDFDLDYTEDIFNKGNGINFKPDFDPSMLDFALPNSVYENCLENINNSLGGCEFPDSCINAFNTILDYEDLYKNSKNIDKAVKNHLHRENRKFIKKEEKRMKKINQKKTKFKKVNKTIYF